MKSFLARISFVEVSIGMWQKERMKTTAERVRHAREKAKLSCAALDSASGLSVGHIAKIEREVSAPSTETLQKIADALELDVRWLAFGSKR